MRIIAALVVLVGCGFRPTGSSPGDGMTPIDGSASSAVDSGSGSNQQPDARLHDASLCWSWTPTNFDSCTLPEDTVALTVSNTMTINTDSPSSLPSVVLTQNDDSKILVIHLSTLDVQNGGAIVATGSMPLVLAVDGVATIDGTIRTIAGADDAARCAARTGAAGQPSTVTDTGGGGAGGGGGAANGGDGTDGTDGNHGSGHGAHGAHGGSISSTLSPLVAGCAGAAGGSSHGVGTPGSAGAGGGAVQISAQMSLSASGTIGAIGGGGGVTAQQTGAGGGGSGGAIFLESLAVTIQTGAHVCADGGAGSEGGGSSNGGNAGGTSPCTGTSGASTDNSGNDYGGNGGTGGFRNTPTGAGAGPASNDSQGGHGAGGGGGGGGVGWIRLRAVGSTPTINGTVTPAPATT